MLQFQKASFLASYGTPEQLPLPKRMEVVFAGRSNVGKSSMLNRLFLRKNLARVSSVPGKTATVNFYQLDPIYLVDLPGYGYAKTSKKEKFRFNRLIRGYFEGGRNLLLIVVLLDIRHSPSDLDKYMLDFCIDNELPFLILLTKADKLSEPKQKERINSFKEEIPYSEQITMIPFSASTGQGVEYLRSVLNELCEDEQ